jgi:hypothetical protein
MSVATVLQGPLFAAYMVGRCKSSRDKAMHDARDTAESSVKCLCVFFARDWNRQVLYWLKKAQS